MISRNSQRNKKDDVDTIRTWKLLFDFQGLLEKRKNRIETEKNSSLFTLASYLKYGGVAQLGEHLPCKQGVKGSNPFISTIGWKNRNVKFKRNKTEDQRWIPEMCK